ncbi:hypothetical protein BJY01DRAFT_228120 [Aspergillus pseudoustus]|uniref:Uncharacterized protein n=1 Tax=Aspergillus pseudoustus TaxID=1810923 RepID=A0ABR4IMQ3_9EURO
MFPRDRHIDTRPAINHSETPPARKTLSLVHMHTTTHVPSSQEGLTELLLSTKTNRRIIL